VTIQTNEKGDGSVEVANPDLCRASVEIERTFLVDLGYGIRRGKNLDANIGSALEQSQPVNILFSLRTEPGNIGRLYAASSGYRALGQGAAVRKQLAQKHDNVDLALTVERSRGRTHEDVTVLIGLDAIRELRQLRVNQELGPAGQVKPGLRRKVWKLDSDRHGQYYTSRRKNA